MTLVVLFILAVVWAVYGVSWARSRSEYRSVNSISSFSKHLSVLERTSPSRSSGPTRIAGPAPQRPTVSLARPAFAPTPYRSATTMSRRQAQERRKNVLIGLAAAVFVTLALSLAFGGMMMYLNLLVDALLVGYVFLLVQMRKLATERQTKVRYLQPTIDLTDGHAPVLLHQSAN